MAIPTTPKSASENVVLAKPREPNTGSKKTGKKVISTPCANAPIIAPRLPPVALPNTPAVAPQKKCGTTPGKISTHLSCPNSTNPTIPPIKLDKKPINTAFGAYGKTIGQSSAGLADGTSFSEIPVNAGTISAKTKRTPCKITKTPAL